MEAARIDAVKSTGPIFVVVNAGSGRNEVDDKVEMLRAGFAGCGRAFDVLIAQGGEQLAAVARRAVDRAVSEGGTLVVAGGDGTINTVGQVALAHELPFGIVPEGTFNYLSRSHGISEDPDEAIRTILDGRIIPVQAGLVNDKVFFVNASLGLYPQLLEDREGYKRRYGRSRLVAVWSALVTLMNQGQQLEIELEADGSRSHLRTPTLFVGNNRLQMEQVGIAAGRVLDHNRLVAVTAKPLGVLSSLRLMLRGFVGRLGEAPEVQSFSFQNLSVQVGKRVKRSRIKVATDGETTFMKTPLTFRPSPHALQLIVPLEARSEQSESAAADSGEAA